MEEKLSLMETKIPQEQQELVDARIQQLQCSIAALLAENEMFERFISRLDPQGLLLTPPESLGDTRTTQLERVGQRWGRRSQCNLPDGLLQLTLDQKLSIAQREVAEVIKEKEKHKDTFEKIKDNYKASLKETEQQRADIRSAKNELEDRLVKPMVKMSNMRGPEKVLQYIRSKGTQCETLKLKIQALKVQEKRLQQQLQEKRDMGKAGHEDIFTEYSEPIMDINLGELRVKLLQAQRVLNSHKEMLQGVTQESIELSSDITRRKEMLEKMEEDMLRAEEERLKAEGLNKQLRHQMSEHQAPDVAQYMHVKDEHKKLQQSVHTWQRKVGIAEMTSKTKSRSKPRGTPVNSADVGTLKLPQIAQDGRV
ncbi:coiled-coil domain-containing protein 113 isoform X2 [Dunckerocampus dactyliophorus]|uniref:coiled-coil domain-containing protein 113 isoform X2 n=1 Tax=Dunckerocampus dactyliophorus TaxID=161453 RepID=UPI002405A709|nr:coiled-coil domain-containing protein 113 isoform X2 [Dunckerocampus dactyliophorus]